MDNLNEKRKNEEHEKTVAHRRFCYVNCQKPSTGIGELVLCARGIKQPELFLDVVKHTIIDFLKIYRQGNVQLTLRCLMKRQLEFEYGEHVQPELLPTSEKIEISGETENWEKLYFKVKTQVLQDFDNLQELAAIYTLDSVERVIVRVEASPALP